MGTQMTPTYSCDSIGVWHQIKHIDEFSHRARGACGHDFELKTAPVAKRPHKDKYCAGCLGAEFAQTVDKR